MLKHYEINRISFDWDENVIPNRPLTNVKIDNDYLKEKIASILSRTQWNTSDYFQPGKTTVTIPSDVLVICDEVFSVVKNLKENSENVLAGYLASILQKQRIVCGLE